MALQDRDYMRVDKPHKKKNKKPSLWNRFRFRLHLLFRGKGKENSAGGNNKK